VEETPHDDLLGSVLPGSARALACPVRRLAERNRKTGRVSGEGAGNSTRGACAPQNCAANASGNVAGFLDRVPDDSPLPPMTLPERVRADYEVMDLTTGPHPMKLVRAQLPEVWRAIDLAQAKNGSIVRIAGNVICRQRPGTAKGFVFISLEDETGVSNAIVTPDLFEETRLLITEEPFLVIEGEVQNTDNVVLIKTQKIFPLIREGLVGSESHDFH